MKTGKRPQNTVASEISDEIYLVNIGGHLEENIVGSVIYTSTRMNFKWNQTL
jgi:hypothetical protein